MNSANFLTSMVTICFNLLFEKTNGAVFWRISQFIFESFDERKNN